MGRGPLGGGGGGTRRGLISQPHLTVGYDTPDSVADVFGHSNATPLHTAASGLRQAGMGGFANLQQVLAGSGIKLTATDEDDESDSSGVSSEDKMDTSEAAQEQKKVSPPLAKSLVKSFWPKG